MKTKTLVKLAFICSLALLWGTGASAGVFKYINNTDGKITDWTGVKPLYTQPTWNAMTTNFMGQNFRDIAVCNDNQLIYIRFSFLGTNGVGGCADPSVYNDFRIWIDTDTNQATGYAVNWQGTPYCGAEIQLRGTWSGALSECTNGNAQLATWTLGYPQWDTAFFGKTPHSTNYEMRIAYVGGYYAAPLDTTKLVFTNGQTFAILAGTVDASGGRDSIFPDPSSGAGVLYYTIAGLATNILTTNLTLIDLVNASWKYNAAGSDLGTNWLNWWFDNDDTIPNPAWNNAPGPLGYTGSPGSWPAIATALPSGPNTYYFRTHFTWSGFSANNLTFVVTNYLSDGAVFYLNGTEVHRTRMPAGTITYTTSATGTASPVGQPEVFTISASALTQGDNVLAVETHQAPSSSDDMVFGFSLTAGAQFPVMFPDPMQPIDQTTVAGTPVTFSVPIIGSGHLTYEWTRNGDPISGAVGATYTFSPALTDNGALYAVMVSNPVSTNTSRAALLTVLSAPIAIANPALPADLTVVEGNPAVFNLSLSGSEPFYYQWFHGSTLVGTNAGYTNLFVLPADGGSYFAIVSNSVNSVTSRTATLTVTLDTTTPTVTSVWGSPNQVVLTFNKALDPTTAAQASRYSINDLSVLTATLNPTNAAQVTLTTGTQRLGKLYVVTVNGVKDLLDNPAVNSVGSFRPTITMDGSFGDWAGVAPINWYSPLPSHDTTATDFKDIYVWDDADFIYFRATTWETTTWQEGHTQMFIDTDNNEYTGYIYWHGSEMETDAGVGLQQKNGSWNEGPLDGLNWLCIPSGTGTNFEFRISKHATYHSDGKPIFTTNVINFVFASYNSSWNVVNAAPTPNDYATPNDGGYFTYYFFNPGTLNITYDPNSGQATVTWDSVTGTLQSCSSLTGTWTDVSGATTSPYVFTPTAGGTQYFRLSQ